LLAVNIRLLQKLAFQVQNLLK